jgi:predicted nucleic acid-binding protein
MTTLAYVDASALVKLVVAEAESVAMERWYVESERVTTSLIGIIETRRAVARRPQARGLLDALLTGIDVIGLNTRLADLAGSISPVDLRTLDAIHLATALSLGSDLTSFVTYDERLAAAARNLGLPVVSPA